MPILTTQELESFKIQMEASINNPSSLFIASELNVVISNLLKDKNFFLNPKLKNIYNEVLIMKEPNNFQTSKLEYPENLERLKVLYKKVTNEINKQIIRKV
ncbi:hypothetical protein [Chishuiella changwenlii]|uniref:hypothetical protein n=1 Tax=Chishuiella changwenlii TaxID=1434701 RepID=UPI002FDB737E